MESAGELAWFRGELWRSVTHPRGFARDLAREHYGLAGVLVALVSGVALAIGIDLLVLASKDLSAGSFVPRLVIDAFLLGVRLAITGAVVAWLTTGAIQLIHRGSASLDQVFTGLTFALAPLVLLPIPAVIAIVATTPETIAIGATLVLVIVIRVLIGIVLNIWSILSPLFAVVALVVVSILGTLVLSDEISRMRFLAYEVVPQVVPDLLVTPATGTTFPMLGFDLTLPSGWTNATSGVPGEAARFESSHATLSVLRASAAALDTADTYANNVMGPQLSGVTDTWHVRTVERINGVIVVDDSYGGNYEGTIVLWRQFTAVPGSQGLALVYRVVKPQDRDALLAEAAAIAATWHIGAAGR